VAVAGNADTLALDPWNPNRGTDRGRAVLADSLRRLGAGRSILVDKHGMAIAGNKTLEAARGLGVTRTIVVPTTGQELVVVQRTDLDLATDATARELAVADNRASELGLEWDAQQLAAILNEGGDLKGYFSERELAQILASVETPAAGLTDPDAVPGERATDIRPGDLFELGRHRLLCGDSKNADDIARVMRGEQGALVLTDPPYGINIVKVGGDGGKPSGRATGRLRGKGPAPFGGVKNKGRDGRWVDANQYYPIHGDNQPFDPTPLLGLAEAQILFGANYFASRLPDGKAWIVWDKDATGMFSECELAWTSLTGRLRLYRHVWSGLRRAGSRDDELAKRVHPTQKPVGLFASILTDFSASGDVIVDPYLGSGSTVIACEQLNRACRGLEIEPHYCQIIIDRWEAFTGQRAVKVSAGRTGADGGKSTERAAPRADVAETPARRSRARRSHA
jgi:hypothetical protein